MRPIGFFDSGVGGLGIFKAVAEKLHNYDLVYVADNANLPFGEKTVDQLNHISETIVRFLIKKHNVQAVVVACNTATVSSIDYLRKHFSIPIVGTVPVVKPACEQSKNKRVAILATPATASSSYLKDLIKKHANDADVLIVSCPGLADMVDTGELDTPEVLEALNRFLAPAIAHHADAIGLGCTQYPFLCHHIAKLFSPQVIILDSNQPVANQVERIMSLQPALAFDKNHKPTYTVYATKDVQTFGKVAQKLIGPMVDNYIYLNLE